MKHNHQKIQKNGCFLICINKFLNIRIVYLIKSSFFDKIVFSFFFLNNFLFKKWQIEFHNFDKEKYNIISPFINLLLKLWYNLEYIDVNWITINEDKIKNIQYDIFTIYFYK